MQDTLYRVYTYSRDLEEGLCQRHKKEELVRLGQLEKQETVYRGHSASEDLSSPELVQSVPCALHNGPLAPCPAHGQQTPATNGTIPGTRLASHNQYSFSPERVI